MKCKSRQCGRSKKKKQDLKLVFLLPCIPGVVPVDALMVTPDFFLLLLFYSCVYMCV